ncbi:MAG: hypothetical protein QNJ48_15675 [Desulfobacterales bacterium]|nr:hypothetical protein [Desulfobacterales bacterium]MDJ0885606.1 hypothetical protein [Desulfobacterales bacterium]
MSPIALIHEALSDHEQGHLDFEALPNASQEMLAAEIKERLRKGITDTLERMNLI